MEFLKRNVFWAVMLAIGGFIFLLAVLLLGPALVERDSLMGQIQELLPSLEAAAMKGQRLANEKQIQALDELGKRFDGAFSESLEFFRQNDVHLETWFLSDVPPGHPLPPGKDGDFLAMYNREKKKLCERLKDMKDGRKFGVGEEAESGFWEKELNPEDVIKFPEEGGDTLMDMQKRFWGLNQIARAVMLAGKPSQARGVLRMEGIQFLDREGAPGGRRPPKVIAGGHGKIIPIRVVVHVQFPDLNKFIGQLLFPTPIDGDEKVYPLSVRTQYLRIDKTKVVEELEKEIRDENAPRDPEAPVKVVIDLELLDFDFEHEESGER